MKKAFCTFLLLAAVCAAAFAQSTESSERRKKELENYLEKVSAYGFSGQILIAEKGKIILDKAYGFADRERKIRSSSDTVFNVASFTKQFTAAAILRLETDGKLKTTDQIGKYLENVPPDKSEITIHQLLSHTSGLTRGNSTKNTTRDESVQKILAGPLAAKPGEKFIYSNSGFHLLAAIIEKISGQTYQDYLTEKLFRLAGMSHSGFFSDTKWQPGLIAQTHNEWSKLESFTDWKKIWNYGSGSVVSNTGDLYRWFRALSANRIIPQAEKEKLFGKYHQSFDEGIFYGYGWYIEQLGDGSSLIFHGGDNPGYHSEFRWYVKDERVIILLANYEMFEPDGVAVQKRIIANNIARILKGEEYKQPPAFVKLSAKELKKYEGDYLLPGGDKFKISSDGNSLSISAEGQEAIDALAGYEGETAKKYADATALSEFILKSIVAGEKEKILARLPKEDYDFYIPFIPKQIAEFAEKMGKLKDFKVQGTVSFPWNPDEYRTNVILRFEKGTTDLFLGWGSGRLNDVTTETGRPFPLIVPLVAQSKTGFSTFEIIRSKLTRINFTGDKIAVKTSTGELIAKRVPINETDGGRNEVSTGNVVTGFRRKNFHR